MLLVNLHNCDEQIMSCTGHHIEIDWKDRKVMFYRSGEPVFKSYGRVAPLNFKRLFNEYKEGVLIVDVEIEGKDEKAQDTVG